jgi:hypothetical protein
MQIISTRNSQSALAPVIEERFTSEELSALHLSTPTDINPKVRETDTIGLAEMISMTVNSRMGWQPRSEKDEMAFLAMIERDIQKFPNLTQNEVLHILNLGLDGEFTEGRVFFNSSEFVRWMKKYIETKRVPALKKKGQLDHQIKDEPISATHQERLKSASDIANGYADSKREDPEFEAFACSGLYQNLEFLGIYSMTEEQKMRVYHQVLNENPKKSDDEIRIKCQVKAYNEFISMLVESDSKLTDTGKLERLTKP